MKMSRTKLFKKNFIKDKTRMYYNRSKNYLLRLIRAGLIKHTVNMLVTGLILHYIINNNNFLAYGLLSAVVIYYSKFYRKLFISKTVEDVNEL